jgi:hypothetical protein
MSSKNSRLRIAKAACAALYLTACSSALAQGFPQDNVNTAGPTPAGWLDAGNPLKQMNEPDCAVAPGKPNVIVCGMNDYSGVDPGSLDTPVNSPELRSVGDSWLGIAMSRDFGRRWIRGIHPCHPADPDCWNGQFYMADPNLSTGPGVLLMSGISGDRNGTQPGGLYMATWLESNAVTGPAYDFVEMVQLKRGTDGPGGGGSFLDKPSQDESLAPPGTPPVVFTVPDPNVPGSTKDVSVPAGSVHFVYSKFLGNDNNLGTQIIYDRYDNYDFSTQALTTKLSEGAEINQGGYVSTRDYGQDTLVVWRRFEDNNEKASIMFVTCNLTKCTKPKVLADFCPHDQGTGRARPRILSLPVSTHTGPNGEWYVFYSDRGDGDMTCLDDQGNPNVNASGVEARLDYSRVMMATWDGKGNANWNLQMLDPQLQDPGNPASLKKKGHQVWPAVNALNGTVQVVWDDTRDSRLYKLIDSVPASSPLSGFFDNPANFGIDRNIEDYVLSSSGGSLSFLPARAYEKESPPPSGTPWRHSIDAWGLQIENGIVGDAYKVSRYPVGISPFTGNAEQLMHSYPAGRLFRKGTRPFYGDYKTVAAVPFRLVQDPASPDGVGEIWEEAEGPPSAGAIVGPTVFYAGFNDNRLVRGDVYYDGCDELTDDCSNTYEIPNQNTPPQALAPLEGEEDPSVTPAACTAAQPKALSRNQKVFVAPIRPGLALTIVSANKPANPAQPRTFVVYLQNSSDDAKNINLSVPDTSPARWNRDPADPTVTDIDVYIPRKAGAVRTLFVEGDPNGIIVTATDIFSGETLQTVVNGNVQFPLKDFDGVVNQETYTLNFLGGRVVSNQDLENQDLENQDLENTVFLQDLENEALLQDLENTSILQDLENQDLENLLYEAQDLENTAVLQQDLENQSLLFQDLENQDLENQDLENDGFDAQDLENQAILFQDLENQDLENGTLSDQPYVEVSWPVDAESNTAVGVNTKILAVPGSTDGLQTQVFVTQTYLTHTVAQSVDAKSGQFCTPQVVADNQVVYNELNPVLDNDVSDPGLSPDVITFFSEPGVPTTITVRVYGDPNFNPNNLGVVVYSQAGDAPTCSPELDPNNPEILDCEIDFAPDTTAPSIGGLPSDPPPNSPFELVQVTDTTFRFDWGGVSAIDEVDGDVDVACSFVDTDGTTIVNIPQLDLDVYPDPGGLLSPIAFGYDFPVGDTFVTCSAEDVSGNIASGSFTVSVEDNLAPALTVPADQLTVSATGAFTPVDIGDATAEDAFLDTVTFDAPGTQVDPNTGDLLFPIGETIVTWTATDTNGNVSTAEQRIVVIDEPPEFSVDNACSITTTDLAGVTIAPGEWVTECPDSFTASDLVDGANVVVSCAPSTLDLGSTEVQCTATDQNGNETDPALPLQVTVSWAYVVEFDRVKKNIESGSSVPLDFRYKDAMDNVVDSSGFDPMVSWQGPFTQPNCGGVNQAFGDGQDSGNSNYRYTGDTWQFNWQTPSFPGPYRVQVDPPGNGEPFLCVTLK